jgi:hypothetical protein
MRRQTPQYNPRAFFRYDLDVGTPNQRVVTAQYSALPGPDARFHRATQRGKQDVAYVHQRVWG